MAQHNHLLINGYTYTPPMIKETLEQWLGDLVKAIGMKVVIEPRAYYVTEEGNRGITAIVGIETSHIAIHVWDEHIPAIVRLDLYTCGDLVVKDVLNKLEKELGLVNYRLMEINRECGFTIVQEK